MTQEIFNEILATKDETIATKDETIAILKSTIADMEVLVDEKDRLIAVLERGSGAKSAAVVSMEERMMDEYSWMMKGAA